MDIKDLRSVNDLASQLADIRKILVTIRKALDINLGFDGSDSSHSMPLKYYPPPSALGSLFADVKDRTAKYYVAKEKELVENLASLGVEA